MAAVTLEKLMQRARFMADMLKGGSSAFVERDDLVDLANVYFSEAFDIMLLASPPDYYSRDFAITTALNKLSYPLPDDYRSLQNVYVIEDQTTSYKRPIRPLGDLECMQYRAPQGTYNLIVQYTPSPPVLEEDADSIDDFSGVGQFIILSMARDMVMKQGGLAQVGAINGQIAQTAARIRTQAGMRRQGAPRYVTQVEYYDWPFIYNQNLNGYRERGGRDGRPSLELYSLYPVWPVTGV